MGEYLRRYMFSKFSFCRSVSLNHSLSLSLSNKTWKVRWLGQTESLNHWLTSYTALYTNTGRNWGFVVSNHKSHGSRTCSAWAHQELEMEPPALLTHCTTWTPAAACHLFPQHNTLIWPSCTVLQKHYWQFTPENQRCSLKKIKQGLGSYKWLGLS